MNTALWWDCNPSLNGKLYLVTTDVLINMSKTVCKYVLKVTWCPEKVFNYSDGFYYCFYEKFVPKYKISVGTFWIYNFQLLDMLWTPNICETFWHRLPPLLMPLASLKSEVCKMLYVERVLWVPVTGRIESWREW